MIEPVACRNCPKVEELQLKLSQANEALQRYREGLNRIIDDYDPAYVGERCLAQIADNTLARVLVMRKG